MKVLKPTREAYQLLHEGTLALAEVERNGVRVDHKRVNYLIASLNEKIRDAEADLITSKIYTVWRETFGSKTKLGSREQLAEVLFKKLGKQMGFTALGQTTSGRDRTDKEALDKLDHPFVRTFLKIQKWEKTLSTYLKGPQRFMVQHADGNYYLHPHYGLNGAATYRSNCDSPNFMNIPKRDEEQAGFARSIYLPHPDEHFSETDYAQIEVRIAAAYHKDPKMIAYLNGEGDMHRDMAKEIYLLTDEHLEVSDKPRHYAKNMFVFPEFYGSVYFQCAKNLWEAIDGYDLKAGNIPLKKHLAKHGIYELGECNPREEARKGTFEYHLKEVERRFWKERFPVYDKWKQKWYNAYLKAGGFRMLNGFVFNGVLDRNGVINYPIQGPAFHCLLWSLIQIVKKIRRERMRSKPIGEIHDAMLSSVPPDELQEYLTISREIMTKKLRKHYKWINVPIEIDVEVADVNDPWNKKKKYVFDGTKWRPR